METTIEAIQRLGIDVKIGDAQRLADLYGQQFDIITAVHVAQYLIDPWALVKGIHEILKVGGVVYIDSFLPAMMDYENKAVAGMSKEEERGLFDYLKSDRRFEVRGLSSLVYCKLDPKLNLPITTLYFGSRANVSPKGIQYRFIAA